MPQGSVTTELNIASGYSGTQVSLNNQSVRLAAGSSATSGAISMDQLRYTLTRTQQGGLLSGTGNIGTAQLGAGNDGIAVSADGNTFAIGGPADNQTPKAGAIGATWVFTRSGTTWSQQAKLVGTGGSGASQAQGTSVALSADGNTLAVGGPEDDGFFGATWIFTRSGTTWTQQGSKLVGTGAVGGPYQGYALALSADGNTLAIGGRFDNSSNGATWVFTRSGTTWSQQGSKLSGTGATGSSTNQGASVALSADGNTLAIGGSFDNSGVGATWVFTRSGTTWSQQGSKLVGTGASGSRQGTSVALSSDGNTLAIGGPQDSSQIGATWIFTRSGTTWTQQGSKLVGTGASGNAFQGNALALSADGNVVAIGGPFDVTTAGAVWVFTRTGTTWSQQGSKTSPPPPVTTSLFFGNSLGMMGTGNTVVVSAYAINSSAGGAYVYI